MSDLHLGRGEGRSLLIRRHPHDDVPGREPAGGKGCYMRGWGRGGVDPQITQKDTDFKTEETKNEEDQDYEQDQNSRP
jgi:hypothetical protein